MIFSISGFNALCGRTNFWRAVQEYSDEVIFQQLFTKISIVLMWFKEFDQRKTIHFFSENVILKLPSQFSCCLHSSLCVSQHFTGIREVTLVWLLMHILVRGYSNYTWHFMALFWPPASLNKWINEWWNYPSLFVSGHNHVGHQSWHKREGEGTRGSRRFRNWSWRGQNIDENWSKGKSLTHFQKQQQQNNCFILLQ